MTSDVKTAVLEERLDGLMSRIDDRFDTLDERLEKIELTQDKLMEAHTMAAGQRTMIKFLWTSIAALVGAGGAQVSNLFHSP